MSQLYLTYLCFALCHQKHCCLSLQQNYVSKLDFLSYCSTHRHILYKHTRQKETANKTTAVINQTTDTRRQMAGCMCKTAVAVILLDANLPRCCLLGFTEGGTVGIFLCVCVCLDVRLSEGKPTLSWVCVFSTLGFRCQRTSVRVMSCPRQSECLQ